MQTINWILPAKETKLVSKVAKRACELEPVLDHQTVMMDLTACHNHGCPLDFEQMLTVDSHHLLHDIFGINRHINRETGKLGGCFHPRLAARATR